MLSNMSKEALITLIICGASFGLIGCAGPTTPFGGLNPWNLNPTSESVENDSEKIPALNFSQILALRGPASDVDSEWNHRKATQDNGQPWVLMDPEQINYLNPVVLRIYIHDPTNRGHRPKLRLTYDDWDLTSKIKDKENWLKVSDSDWQFTSNQLKFSPARVGELKVSFLAHLNSRWVSTKLVEPQCQFAENPQDAFIRQTGKFQVDPKLLEKIESLSTADKVNPNLIAGLIAQESAFNSRAVSYSRALGLTQVTPVAEKEILGIHPEFPVFPGINKYSFLRLLTLVKMEEIGPEQEWRLDPDQSIRGGISYLTMVREYWNRYSKLRETRSPSSLSPNPKAISEQDKLLLTLASYNSGPARVKRAYIQSPKMWLKDENLTEARTYVHKISSYCANFSNEPTIGKGH